MKPFSGSSNQPYFIVIISLTLGLLFDYFFFLKIPGISFLIYIVLVLVGLWLIAVSHQRQITKNQLLLIVPLLFFSSMLAVRDSPSLSFFNVLASLGLLLLIASSLHGRKISHYGFGDYFRLIILPFSFLPPAIRTFLQLMPTSRPSRSRLGPIIKGAVITIPILAVFIALFASADLVFAKYVSQIFSFNFTLDPLFTFRTILVLIVTFSLTGAYSYIFRTEPKDQSQPQPRYNLGTIEAKILIGSISVLFLIFIIVQLTYLFGGQSNIAALGITYAQYARKGFFELVTVAIISLLLIWSVQKTLSSPDSQPSQALKLLSSLLIIEVLVIMLSAYLRLLLYEQAYGFTELRFYSHVFVIWLGIVYLFLLYKIIANGSEQRFIFKSALSSIAVLAALNIFNPDAFVARQNIGHFATTGKLDAAHLSALSDDALPETIKLLDSSDQNLRQSFAHYLYVNRQERQGSPLYSQWSSANLSRTKASQILQSKASILEQSKDYQPINAQP